MKIIRNNGKIPELTGKYILEGYSPKYHRHIYAKVSLGKAIKYLLMKTKIIKSTYF